MSVVGVFRFMLHEFGLPLCRRDRHVSGLAYARGGAGPVPASGRALVEPSAHVMGRPRPDWLLDEHDDDAAAAADGAGREGDTDRRGAGEAHAEVAARQNADQAPRKGDPGTYNDFWFERGALNNRTSLVIDPRTDDCRR